MPFTQEQLAQLKKAYASGALLVRYGDHEVRYKSEAEMRRTIEKLERELGIKNPKPKLHRFAFHKGLR